MTAPEAPTPAEVAALHRAARGLARGRTLPPGTYVADVAAFYGLTDADGAAVPGWLAVLADLADEHREAFAAALAS